MGFSDQQMRALSRSVPSRNVRTRVSAGKKLTYIEGWYALAQANRIFGFDGWDRETIETKCVQQRETRGHCAAVYSARVRITVRAGDRVIVRDGHGTGEAHGDSAGEVHDRALKAAETDATKRALATFDKAFGLALYVGAGRPSDTYE
jgi:recombination DNA repair RAD52 pathway protein